MAKLSLDHSVLSQMPDITAGIVKRSVKDMVGDKLAATIAAGVLQVGDVLPGERELAAAFRVSRETIRGAVQTLAARGIIEVSHGVRSRVVKSDVGPLTIGIGTPKVIDGYDLESVHAARLLVERQVVMDAAEVIDDETLDQLEGLLVAQRAAADAPVQFLISDREFHLAIYQSARNKLLADFVTDLFTYMMTHRRRAVAQRGAVLKSCQDHEAILAGLRKRDPEAVERAFGTHLDRIYDTTRSIIQTVETGQPDDDAAGQERA